MYIFLGSIWKRKKKKPSKGNFKQNSLILKKKKIWYDKIIGSVFTKAILNLLSYECYSIKEQSCYAQ